MRTLVVGDIHGAHKALRQCFERSGFDARKDRLVVIGDVCDGYPEVRQCIDELLQVRHCEMILGNHDAWALDWARKGERPWLWTSQGGDNTIRSYGGGPMPREHVEFLAGARPWLKLGGQAFVHGGFDPGLPLDVQPAGFLMWDRDLLARARWAHLAGSRERFGGFRDIFLGHTPTDMYGAKEPLHFCNVWAIDTGAGWNGQLTIMDIKTKGYWQSDPSPELYGRPGR